MASQYPTTSPEIIVSKGKALTTSRSVADFFGKRHADVIRRVESIDCSKDFTERNFTLSEYTDPTGRSLPMYQITKNGFVFLVMGFTGKKAAEFKEAYIAEFDKMESELLAQRVGEVTIGDLVGTAGKLPAPTTMNIRDGRRGKSATASKAAQRIADECVPMIIKAVQNQYHYSNENVGPAEFLPALLSDKGKTQLHALLRELAENGHDVSGAHRELEVVRYMLAQQQKMMLDIATHAAYIQQAMKIQ